ncbi:hypothetical protein OF83DRAFT_1173830, partial [Amylostereum chailletii]
DELHSFFDPSVQTIIRAIDAQKKATGSKKISTFCLVGGFAASDYLFSKLKEHLEAEGLHLFRPDEHTGKAVAEGAVSFHIDHYVSARVAKVTYGVEGAAPYNERNWSHKRRETEAYVHLSGELYIPHVFCPIILKGTQVSETRQFEESFRASSKKKKESRWAEYEILCYRGDDVPEFVDEPGRPFATLCKVSADVSGAPTVIRKGPFGPYHERQHSIVMSLGLTELKAHVTWSAQGIKKQGPASVVYDDDFAVTVAD